LDAFQLLQVMMNVMENAYDAAVPVNATDPQRDITLERSATHFTLRFAYKGPGVPPENMGRIFDPFFTTKSVGRGTALGLSISYSNIERHGGQLRVENAAGGGAVFYMVLGVG
jgi:C4-dicarboxylate-specific signal transduction histidine kinase